MARNYDDAGHNDVQGIEGQGRRRQGSAKDGRVSIGDQGEGYLITQCVWLPLGTEGTPLSVVPIGVAKGDGAAAPR